ncbi:Mor transcription activator family protein [Comamonas testosteroni]|uniref:Mor transcription activator family protein n=1 Tax=Comamonas testosteroni TaxID=285 RepID=UPI0006B88BDC|nr:Mor transcription activator family protein [Comamonas testosteroni]
MELATEFKAAKRGTTCMGDEFSAHLTALIGEHLVKAGIGPRQAETAALDFLGEMRLQFGGQSLYFTMGSRTKINERYQEIYRRHSSNELKVTELAREYGYSIQWIYNILHIVREQNRREHDAIHQASRAKAHERWKREN